MVIETISDHVSKLIGYQSNGHGETGPKLSYGGNPKSLSHLVSKRYRVVIEGRTDWNTDRITVANMRYSYARYRM